jgi:hypothetical protein
MIGAGRVRKREGRSNSHGKRGGSSEGISGRTRVHHLTHRPKRIGAVRAPVQTSRPRVSSAHDVSFRFSCTARLHRSWLPRCPSITSYPQTQTTWALWWRLAYRVHDWIIVFSVKYFDLPVSDVSPQRGNRRRCRSSTWMLRQLSSKDVRGELGVPHRRYHALEAGKQHRRSKMDALVRLLGIALGCLAG